jgi:hypothetical protein
MMIQLRGASGSGKSTVGYHLLHTYPHVPVWKADWRKTSGLPSRQPLESYPISKTPKVSAYRLPGGLVVAGRYPDGPRGGTGGLDSFRPLEQVYQWLMELATTSRYVYFESLMLAHSMFPVLKYADAIGKDNVIYGFLDTPFEVCVKRMLARVKPGTESSTKTLQEQFAKMKYLRRRYDELGYRCLTIPYVDQVDTVETLFRLEGWNPEADEAFVDQEDALLPRRLTSDEFIINSIV